MELKRTYDEAFKRSPMNFVKEDDFYVEHTIYKATKPQFNAKNFFFNINTTENLKFEYHESVIKGTATSATMYTMEKKATKTELIELFSLISINDIWNVKFLKNNDDPNWQADLVAQIQSMNKDDAVKYVKKDFKTFGKTTRELIGQKVALRSDNNYYTVRDLSIYFDEMDKNGVEEAGKKSIRKLDVNTIQSLIFNNIKYTLK